MSLFDEQPNISNLFSHSDEDEELNIYKKPFEEDTENFKYLPEMKEDLFEKQSPLFIDNENFINYFMKIDYNTVLNPDKIELNNSSKSESDTPKKETDDSNEIKNENLSKKTKRDKIKVKDNFIRSSERITYSEMDSVISV